MTDDQDKDEHVISEIIYRDVPITVVEAPVQQVEIINHHSGYTVAIPTTTVKRLVQAHLLAAFIGGLIIAVQLLINHDLDDTP